MINKNVVVIIVAVVLVSVVGAVLLTQTSLLFNTQKPSDSSLLEIKEASISSSLFALQVDAWNNKDKANMSGYEIELEQLLLFNETQDLLFEEHLGYVMQENYTFSVQRYVDEADPLNHKLYLKEPYFETGRSYYVQISGIDSYSNVRLWSNLFEVVAPEQEPVAMSEQTVSDWFVVHEVDCQYYRDGDELLYVTIENLKDVRLFVQFGQIFDKETGQSLSWDGKLSPKLEPSETKKVLVSRLDNQARVLRPDRKYILRLKVAFEYVPMVENHWSAPVEFELNLDFVSGNVIRNSWQQIGEEMDFQVTYKFLSIKTANISSVLVSTEYDGAYKEYSFEHLSENVEEHSGVVHFGTDYYDVPVWFRFVFVGNYEMKIGNIDMPAVEKNPIFSNKEIISNPGGTNSIRFTVTTDSVTSVQLMFEIKANLSETGERFGASMGDVAVNNSRTLTLTFVEPDDPRFSILPTIQADTIYTVDPYYSYDWPSDWVYGITAVYNNWVGALTGSLSELRTSQ